MTAASEYPARSLMKVRLACLLAAAALFLLEVVIATAFRSNTFVRGSVGDLLVVMLVYCMFRGITGLGRGAAFAFGLSCGVLAELLQALDVADRLGFPPGSVVHVLLGSTFSIADFGMYLLGGLLAVKTDYWYGKVAEDGKT